MKIAIFSVLLTLISNTALAVDYVCRGEADEPVIEIVEENGRPQFRYVVDGESQFFLNMNQGTIQPVTDLPIGFDAGHTFTFRPNWGETQVHIYGRILPKGAIFDVFVLGMLGNVQRSLVNYDCEVGSL